ncbi:MAG: hypothetical protein WCL02_08770 [bacterium]
MQLVKDFIEVEAFPQDLPHDVTIDISAIQTVNDVIVVGDLKFSSKVEVLDDPEQAIVTVLILTEETEEASTAAAEVTPAATPAPVKDDKK